MKNEYYINLSNKYTETIRNTVYLENSLIHELSKLADCLEKENEDLKSIIKEVREFIDRRDLDFGSEEHDHVLEMLDKVNKYD